MSSSSSFCASAPPPPSGRAPFPAAGAESGRSSRSSASTWPPTGSASASCSEPLKPRSSAGSPSPPKAPAPTPRRPGFPPDRWPCLLQHGFGGRGGWGGGGLGQRRCSIALLREGHNDCARPRFLGLGLGLLSPGVFARLTKLSLRRVRFLAPYDLSDVVSSPSCPCLQKLKVSDSQGLHSLSIHCESLLQIKLTNLGTLRELTIVAPTLQKLRMTYGLFYDGETEPIANISAPQLVSLKWRDVYDQELVHLGNLGRLRRLTTSFFLVYGLQGENHSCLSLLNRFQVLHSLNLSLVYRQDIVDFQYLMGDITRLPQITFLHIGVLNQGHVFGASLFHLLRICTGLRRLSLALHNHSSLEAQSACPSGCICDQPTSWKTEELLLNHLVDIRIRGLQGAEHEVTFLK